MDGGGVAADAARLAELAITDAERAKLATLYTAGESLWRVRVSHFTPYDYNLPVYPPAGAEIPRQPKPSGADQDKKPKDCQSAGSIIECTNQILGEALGISGTPYTLSYRSDRVPGRTSARTLEVSLTGATPPAGLKRVDLRIDIAGQQLTQSFSPAAALSHTFTWDGLDAFGRTVQGAPEADVSIGYVYDADYARPSDDQLEAFAREGTDALTTNPAREEVTLWQTLGQQVGGWDARAQVGLGGWTLSPHHTYDPNTRTLYYGDGGRRTVRDLSMIVTAAGTGQMGFGGDGGPAEEAVLHSPNDLRLSRDASGTPDGGYYVADSDNCRIRHVAPDETITTVAGSGCRYEADGTTPAPASGDGGPAAAAVLHPSLGEIAQGPDGSLYISDAGHYSIRRVAPDGTISTVAGYDWLHGADPGPTTATQVQFVNEPRGLAVSKYGDLYVGVQSSTSFGAIYRFSAPFLEPEIVLQGELNNGFYHYLRDPHYLELDDNGDLYIADGFSNSIFRYDWSGTFSEIAGGCQTLPGGQLVCTGDSGDGGLATEALLDFPTGLRIKADGSVLFTDLNNHRVREVTPTGILLTLAGTGTPGFNGDGRPASQTQLSSPVGLELLPNGDLLVSDAGNNRVRRIEDVLPPVPQTGLILIPEEDGATRYVFDLTGRHLRTEDARTGEVLLSFGYSPEGFVTSVTDAFGNVTTIEWDASGDPQAIVAPFGQRTDLTLDANGYLDTVTNPAAETVDLTHGPDGLLTGLTDPKLGPYVFQYDALGRLEKDQNPVGGFTQLARTALAPSGNVESGFDVTKSSALGRTTVYRTEELTDGTTRVSVTSPTGLVTASLQGADGSRITTTPDGTVATATQGPDPRFTMQAPRLESLTVSTPGGLTSTTNTSRAVTLVDPAGDPAEPANVASLTETVTVNGKTATSVRDFVGRTVTATTPEGRQSATSYDVFGRTTEVQAPGFAAVQYGYDTRGRLETVTQGTRTTTYSYNALTGYLASVTDPASRQVSFIYDAAGRVKTQTLPDSRQIAFSYDANGNLTSITPPGRPAHGFDYTADDRPETYTPPDIGLTERATTLSYNLDGQLDLVTRPDGQTIDPVYDTASGRLASVITPRGTTSYSYDPTSGNLSTVTDPTGGTISYGYDASLPTSVTWSGDVAGSVGFTYDNDFEIVARTVNGANAVSYGYDQDGLLTSAGTLTLTRDPASGFLTGTSLGSLTDTTTYDPTYGEMSSYTATDSGTELFSVDYTVRDDLGRIKQRVETLGGVTATYDYTYDLAGRLTDIDKDGTPQAHYDYDANSNRTGWTDPWGTGTASYDDQDRLTDYNGTTYTYSSNGELESKTSGTQTVTYDYDVLGSLRQVILADGVTIDYVIDAAGRRVGKKVGGVLTQGFLYQDQLNPVAELDGTGAVVSTFVYASKPNVPDYLVKAGTIFRVISDHLGSVRLVVNTSDGTIAQRLDYDAFGRVMLDTNPGFQPFGFAGGLYDPQTGLVRFGARDYDPETGRWTSKDPVGFSGGDANLYGYVVNDPTNLSDSSGLWAGIDDAIFALGGGLVGLAGQAVGDLLSGSLSGWEDYTGSFVGGAAGGWALLYTGPIGAGAAGGATANAVKQWLKMATGKQCGFNFESLAVDTGIGALTGFIPGARVPGVTAGRNSYNAVFRQMTTKFERNLVSTVRTRTAAKMFAGRATDAALVPGSGAAAVAGLGTARLLNDQDCGCN